MTLASHTEPVGEASVSFPFKAAEGGDLLCLTLTAQSGRMLTIFALYVRYTGDTRFLLGHFPRVRAVSHAGLKSS